MMEHGLTKQRLKFYVYLVTKIFSAIGAYKHHRMSCSFYVEFVYAARKIGNNVLYNFSKMKTLKMNS